MRYKCSERRAKRHCSETNRVPFYFSNGTVQIEKTWSAFLAEHVLSSSNIYSPNAVLTQPPAFIMCGLYANNFTSLKVLHYLEKIRIIYNIDIRRLQNDSNITLIYK